MEESAVDPQDSREHRRLLALKDLKVLDTKPSETVETVCRIAKRVLGYETVLVSLIDADRQWFLRKSGIIRDAETPRSWAFCQHAITQDDVYEVLDAAKDPLFKDNPLVTGNSHLRYYAGAPLTLSDGTHPGTLCVLSDRPGPPLNDEQRLLLSDLAGLVARELELASHLCKLTAAMEGNT